MRQECRAEALGLLWKLSQRFFELDYRHRISDVLFTNGIALTSASKQIGEGL